MRLDYSRVLVLNLEGRMAAWPSFQRSMDKNLSKRKGSEAEPTEAVVYGIIEAAMGIAYDDDEERQNLRNSVKIIKTIDLNDDKFGKNRRFTDFQTWHTSRDKADPGKFYTASGSYKESSPPMTDKEYITDVHYHIHLVATDGHAGTLDEISESLNHPLFVPYLGRKCCIPSAPLNGGFLPGINLDER